MWASIMKAVNAIGKLFGKKEVSVDLGEYEPVVDAGLTYAASAIVSYFAK